MGQREGVGEAEKVAWVQLRSGSIRFHLRFYAVVFVQRCMLIHRQTGFSVGPEFPQQVRGFQSPGESSPLSGHLPEALIGPLEGVGPSEPVSGLTCPGPRPQLGPHRRHFGPETGRLGRRVGRIWDPRAPWSTKHWVSHPFLSQMVSRGAWAGWTAVVKLGVLSYSLSEVVTGRLLWPGAVLSVGDTDVLCRGLRRGDLSAEVGMTVTIWRLECQAEGTGRAKALGQERPGSHRMECGGQA